jgi:hypothetical protein
MMCGAPGPGTGATFVARWSKEFSLEVPEQWADVIDRVEALDRAHVASDPGPFVRPYVTGEMWPVFYEHPIDVLLVIPRRLDDQDWFFQKIPAVLHGRLRDGHQVDVLCMPVFCVLGEFPSHMTQPLVIDWVMDLAGTAVPVTNGEALAYASIQPNGRLG